MKAKFALLARVSGQYLSVEFHKGVPIAPAGASSYYVRFSVDGVRHTKPLGKDLQTAHLEIQNLELGREYQKRGLPAPLTLIARENSLAIRAQEYLAEVRANKEPGTWTSYTQSMNYFLSFCKRSTLQTITRADLLDFKNYLREEGYSERTVFNHFGNVVIFLKWAGTPVLLKRGDRPDMDEHDPEEYSGEELNAMLQHATREDRLVVNLLLCSGMRSGELAHLTYKDVDFRFNILTVCQKDGWKTKTKTSRREIPIPPWLAQQLKERKENFKRHPGDPVFVRPSGRPYNNQSLLDLVQRVARPVEVAGKIKVHKFRSTYITRCLRAGMSVPDVMRLVGHVNPETMMRYAAKANLRRPEVHERATSAFASFAGVGD